jgi:hypothetical protein
MKKEPTEYLRVCADKPARQHKAYPEIVIFPVWDGRKESTLHVAMPNPDVAYWLVNQWNAYGDSKNLAFDLEHLAIRVKMFSEALKKERGL